MKMQNKNMFIGIIVLTVIAFPPIAVMAGSLEPSSPPTAGTMRTLDDIYNKTNNATALPKPEEVTIITKTGQASEGFQNQTLHTVTSGKTFYLMGVSGSGVYLSLFDGTTSTTILNVSGGSIVPSYPIAAIASGTQIRISTNGQSLSGFINFWGYEK